MSRQRLILLAAAPCLILLVLALTHTAAEEPAAPVGDIPTQWTGLWGAFNVEEGEMLDKEYCKLIECEIDQRDGMWHARFEGECGRPYKYTITMEGRPINGVLLFKGTVDLGPEDGGVYDWIGRADENNFVGFYTNAHYTGVFRMTPAE